MPDPSGRLEIRSTVRIRKLYLYDFRRAPVVGVPIAEVANTLVQCLRWMAGSYVGPLDTKRLPVGRRASNTQVLQYLDISMTLPT
jgi:hypothetical protein